MIRERFGFLKGWMIGISMSRSTEISKARSRAKTITLLLKMGNRQMLLKKNIMER